jgi:DNA-binding transcriptional LysR family regulator
MPANWRPPLPLLLSLNAGFVDAAGFLALQGLFTAHVTGNFVTLGASLVFGTTGAVAKLLALPVFCLVVIMIQPPWSLCVNNAEVLRDAAIRGRGVALIPTFIAGEALDRGTLRAVLQDYQAPQLALYAIYPPTRHLSVKVRLFIDFLVERFSLDAT